MQKLYIDVSGLALIAQDSSIHKAFFVDVSQGGTALAHNAPIPPHHVFLGIPSRQIATPQRKSDFSYVHQGAQRLFGPNNTACDCHLLGRDNNTARPADDLFYEISVEGAQTPTAGGNLNGVLDMKPVVGSDIPQRTINGTARAVAAIFDSSDGVADPRILPGGALQFGTHNGSFSHVVRYVYDFAPSDTPVIRLNRRNSGGTNSNVFRISLKDPEAIDRTAAGGQIDGWHLFLVDVPFGELFGYHAPRHRELHHFEPIYNLYGYGPNEPRPVPVRPEMSAGASMAFGPPLGDPGYCGPPTSG
ncbi:MAG TPA: hypothetical protein VFO89_15535 [Thermoanaerobaculia bacterium]|nr:hypothetical protein [Thermoanaerobaculia bacterium]